MDPKIKQHADNLYMRGQSRVSESCREAIKEQRLAWAKQNLSQFPLGGTEVQALERIYGDHVERYIAARLNSYIEAFSDAASQPTENDFQEIWRSIKETMDRHLGSAARALQEYIKQRGGWHAPPVDWTELVKNHVAHGHDRVLNDWKVWRSRVGIIRAAPQELPTVNIEAPGGHVQIGSIVTSQKVGTATVQSPITNTTLNATLEQPPSGSEAAWLKTWWGKVVVGVITTVAVAALSYTVNLLRPLLDSPKSLQQRQDKNKPTDSDNQVLRSQPPSSPSDKAGMASNATVVVRRASPDSGAHTAVVATTGNGEQEIKLGATPSKLMFEPPGVTVSGNDLPKDIHIGGKTVTVVRYTDTGFVIDDHKQWDLHFTVYMLEGAPNHR